QEHVPAPGPSAGQARSKPLESQSISPEHVPEPVPGSCPALSSGRAWTAATGGGRGGARLRRVHKEGDAARAVRTTGRRACPCQPRTGEAHSCVWTQARRTGTSPRTVPSSPSNGIWSRTTKGGHDSTAARKLLRQFEETLRLTVSAIRHV